MIQTKFATRKMIFKIVLRIKEKMPALIQILKSLWTLMR